MAVEILHSISFGRLKYYGGGYHVSHPCTLRKTSRTIVGVHGSYDT